MAREADNSVMNPARLLPLALLAIATTASAQSFYTPQPGAPANPNVAPGVTGTASGPSGTIATGSTASGDWQTEAARKMDGRPRDSSRRNASRPAKASELTAGASIADNKGTEVGHIKSVDPDGVIVETAAGYIKVPADAIGKNNAGLLIGMSKADFDKLVAQAVGS
jgi:hypothetical protein